VSQKVNPPANPDSDNHTNNLFWRSEREARNLNKEQADINETVASFREYMRTY